MAEHCLATKVPKDLLNLPTYDIKSDMIIVSEEFPSLNRKPFN